MKKPRRKLFPISLSEKEKAGIKKLADEEQLSMSEYIRMKALNRL